MALDKLQTVEIEPDGVFKYVLIELKEKDKKDKKGRKKTVVRGFEWAEFHGKQTIHVLQTVELGVWH